MNHFQLQRSKRWWGKVVLGGWFFLRCYVLLVLVMMLLERYLIFFPTRSGQWNPPGLEFEEAFFEAPDGVRLHGGVLEHPDPRAVVLFAHGNAGNLSHRAEMMEELRRRLRVSVFIFDYRGYGKSSGSPTEQGILQDAQAARRWLAQRTGVGEDQLVLMGRSLGGAVVAHLAAQQTPAALILDSTFTCLPDVAAYHYPWLPVRWLMRTRLDAQAQLACYQGPLLQFHGDQDRIVPYELGQKLFQAAASRPKQFVTLKDHDHNDPWPAEFYEHLDRFLNQVLPNSP